MSLTLYNTLTRRKEPFEPIDPSHVRMYVCGPTVYDWAHIGNARPVIVFDLLYRLLRRLYGPDSVTYVRNITDVDDKIVARAAEEGVAIEELTDRTARQFHQDMAALGCLLPDIEPRATLYIPRMIAMIESLLAKGCAYEAERHVLFHVASMPSYGRLSRRSTDEMIAGARVEVAPYKRDPMDFVLWKPSREGEPGWESPWGRGRPGWHIECSAMAKTYLGEVFDIHGGGIDLVFPHHENEIAQSTCAHGTDLMARVWMHNGYLQVEGRKMSKSLGNFVTNRELLLRVAGPVLRYTMLKTHYREPLNWTETSVQESRAELLEWATFLQRFPGFESGHVEETDDEFMAALCDDMNTPMAIARLRELFGLATERPNDWARKFVSSIVFVGLDKLDNAGHFRSGVACWAPLGMEAKAERAQMLAVRARAAMANDLPEAAPLLRKISELGAEIDFAPDGDIRLSFEGPFKERVGERIRARAEARKARDFEEADRIRDELARMGIQLKDGKDPKTGEPVTAWEPAR